MSENDIKATSHFQDLGQMRILELPGAVPYGETALPIQPTEVAFIDQRRSDASMLKEANMNREESESFIATRGLIGRWNMAEIMLRAWVEPIKWKNSEQFRSHLGIPLVAEQFYSIHSVVNQTLFGGYRVFKIDPTSGTPLECAEAQEAILNAQLKTCGYKGVSAKTEMRQVTYDGLFYGFGIAHYGWQHIKQDIIKKVPRMHPEVVVVDGNLVQIPVASQDEDDIEDKKMPDLTSRDYVAMASIRSLQMDASRSSPISSARLANQSSSPSPSTFGGVLRSCTTTPPSG